MTPSSQTTISNMTYLSLPRSRAIAMICGVALIPSELLTSLTLGASLRMPRISSVLLSLESWATTVCTCMRVVEALTAMVLMFSQGMTLCTSGPWWVGSLTEGSRPLMGPFFASPGSAARLTMVTKAFWILTALSIGYSVLSRAVVLQETTLENWAPQDSA